MTIATATRPAAAPATTYVFNPGFQQLPVALIDASPTNPRKTFDATKIAELAESVKSHGVLQPILVRYHPAKTGRLELVAGERRWRAAKLAGLETIPANLQELDELQVLEIQVIENLQRDDLHELEEAEGYEKLMKKFAITVEQLAGKVGKSKAYIYARLKLCALAGVARKAFAAGELDASTALLLARIPVTKLQEEACVEITKPKWRDHPLSYREAARHIRERYMLMLSAAPFKASDTTLLKTAPACTACPKRTGNAPDLFGDVGNDNVCTDPQCYADKRDAHAQRVVEEAKAAGREVLTGKAAKKVLSWEHVRPEGYVRLDDTLPNDEKRRTYAKVLGKEAEAKTVLCESPDNPGTFVKLMKDADIAPLLKAKGIATKKAKGTATKASPAQIKEREDAAIAAEVNFRAYLALRDLVGKEGISNVELRELVTDKMDHNDISGRLAKLWGLEVDDRGNVRSSDEDVAAVIAQASGLQLLQMAYDALFDPGDATLPLYGEEQMQATRIAAARGINLGEIEQQVRADAKAAAKPKKPGTDTVKDLIEKKKAKGKNA